MVLSYFFVERFWSPWSSQPTSLGAQVKDLFTCCVVKMKQHTAYVDPSGFILKLKELDTHTHLYIYIYTVHKSHRPPLLDNVSMTFNE